jgi:prefoldin subunit 4
MLTREQEVDTEVTPRDQENINEFGRLNARLHEVRGEHEGYSSRLEKLDDAATELMMGGGDDVHLLLGDAFIVATEDDATAYCEAQVEKLQGVVDELEEEKGRIEDRQKELKVELYGRFGSSINLEEDGPAK